MVCWCLESAWVLLPLTSKVYVYNTSDPLHKALGHLLSLWALSWGFNGREVGMLHH